MSRPTPEEIADVLMRYCGIPLHPDCRAKIALAIAAERAEQNRLRLELEAQKVLVAELRAPEPDGGQGAT